MLAQIRTLKSITNTILYLEGSKLRIATQHFISGIEDCFIVAINADPYGGITPGSTPFAKLSVYTFPIKKIIKTGNLLTGTLPNSEDPDEMQLAFKCCISSGSALFAKIKITFNVRNAP